MSFNDEHPTFSLSPAQRQALLALPYDHIVFCDTEYTPRAGENPVPICAHFYELRSGREVAMWGDELSRGFPFPGGPTTLFVSFYAPAELAIFEGLGWVIDFDILDLWAEAKNLFNLPPLFGVEPLKYNLNAVLAHLDLPVATEDAHKKEMQERCTQGGPFDDDERISIQKYCRADVLILLALLAAILARAGWGDGNRNNALERGRVMGTTAKIQRRGIPANRAAYERFSKARPHVVAKIVAESGSPFCNEKGSIIDAPLAAWVERNGIADWPRTPKGKFSKKLAHFKDRQAEYPELASLIDLKTFVDKLKKVTLEIGADDRCRFEPRPFKTITGRFAPKGSPYAAAAWTRVWMESRDGKVLIEFDWTAQEAEIFAQLSQDQAMIKACASGDLPHWVATENGAIPPGATEDETKVIRDLFKVTFYANTYGAQAPRIASQLRIPVQDAAAIKCKIDITFRVGYAWLRRARAMAFQRGQIETPLKTWSMRVPERTKVTSIQNWPIQAAGAEMLRRALVLADVSGVSILCPVHDAILIEAPADAWGAACVAVISAMNQASREVLDGHVIPIKVKKLEGEPNKIWLRIQKIIDDLGDIPDPPPKKKRRPVQKGDGKTVHPSTKKALATMTARLEKADDVDALNQFFGAARLTQKFLNNGSLSPEAAEDALVKMRGTAIGSGAEAREIEGTERRARDTDERAGPSMPRGNAGTVRAILDQIHDEASLLASVEQMRLLVRDGVISIPFASRLLKRAADDMRRGSSHA